MENEVSEMTSSRHITSGSHAVQTGVAATTLLSDIGQMNNLTKTLELLVSDRLAWEDGANRTSNQGLYALLANCQAIAQVATPELVKQRNVGLTAFAKMHGYADRKDSPAATRVVKAVFGAVDRRRISTYSLVLRSAMAANVFPTNLASWIEQNGGIQEIRLARSPNYVSPKQKAEQAKSSLSKLPNLAVAKEGLAKLADAEHIGTECVLLAEQQADGTFHIKSMTRNATAVNAALAALYADQAKAA